ncbi:hypothetical protein I4U23_009399 [Adineta vaga]|nr:hypothetical protein I4U23_009399 [Adineta vaga]
MALIPFSRYRFLDDPFFFHRFDLYDPWFDFDLFPFFPPITPRYQRVKHQERISYTTTSSTNNTKTNDNYEPLQRKDTNRQTSYITPSNTLAVEIPIQNSNNDRRLQQVKDNSQSLTQFSRYQDRSFDDNLFSNDTDIQPRTVDKGNNQKYLEWSIDMKNFRPEEINVSVNNNRLVIQGEHRQEQPSRSERSSFYKSTTLPPGTRVDQLQSRFNDGQLKIEAPLSS